MDAVNRPAYRQQMNAETLRNWIVAAVKKANLRQVELARQLSETLQRSIDPAAVNKMLSGDRRIAADEALVIEAITNSPLPRLIEPSADRSMIHMDTVRDVIESAQRNQLFVGIDAQSAADAVVAACLTIDRNRLIAEKQMLIDAVVDFERERRQRRQAPPQPDATENNT